MYQELFYIGLPPYGYHHNTLTRSFLEELCGILQRKFYTIFIIGKFFRSYYIAPISISEYVMLSGSVETTWMHYQFPYSLVQSCRLFRSVRATLG